MTRRFVSSNAGHCKKKVTKSVAKRPDKPSAANVNRAQQLLSNNKDLMTIFGIICAYNEAEKIGSTVTETKKNVNRVIVVDDCSTDDTFQNAKKAGADIIIRHERNMGQGAAICNGLERAYNEGAKIAVTLDGDFQHNPNEIPLLTNLIKNGKCDVVLGSRFLRGIQHIPKFRFLFNMVLSSFYFLLFHFKTIDSQTGFRAFNRKSMKLMKLTVYRYDWTCEMASIIVKHKLKYSETPITVRYFEKAHQAGALDGIKMVWGLFVFYLKMKRREQVL